jgi:hypothetical protein
MLVFFFVYFSVFISVLRNIPSSLCSYLSPSITSSKLLNNTQSSTNPSLQSSQSPSLFEISILPQSKSQTSRPFSTSSNNQSENSDLQFLPIFDHFQSSDSHSSFQNQNSLLSESLSRPPSAASFSPSSSPSLISLIAHSNSSKIPNKNIIVNGIPQPVILIAYPSFLSPFDYLNSSTNSSPAISSFINPLNSSPLGRASSQPTRCDLFIKINTFPFFYILSSLYYFVNSKNSKIKESQDYVFSSSVFPNFSKHSLSFLHKSPTFLSLFFSPFIITVYLSSSSGIGLPSSIALILCSETIWAFKNWILSFVENSSESSLLSPPSFFLNSIISFLNTYVQFSLPISALSDESLHLVFCFHSGTYHPDVFEEVFNILFFFFFFI